MDPKGSLLILNYLATVSSDGFKNALLANSEQLTIAINKQITNGAIDHVLKLLEHASFVGISDSFIKKHCAAAIRDRYVLGNTLMRDRDVNRNDFIKLAKFTLSDNEQKALLQHLESIKDDDITIISLLKYEKHMLENNQELASAFRKIADEIVLFYTQQNKNLGEVKNKITSINASIGYNLLSVNAEINFKTLTDILTNREQLFWAGYIPRNTELLEGQSLRSVTDTHSASDVSSIWQASEFYYTNVLKQLDVLDEQKHLKDNTLDAAADRYYQELANIELFIDTDIPDKVKEFMQTLAQDKSEYTVVSKPSRIALTRKQMIGAAYLLHETSPESKITSSESKITSSESKITSSESADKQKLNIKELTQQVYDSAMAYGNVQNPSCGPGTATRISAAFVAIQPTLLNLYEEYIKINEPIIENKDKLAEAVAHNLVQWAQESEEHAQILKDFTAGDTYLYSIESAQKTLQVNRETLPDNRMLVRINITLCGLLRILGARLPKASELYAVAGAVLETKLIRDHIIAGEITGQMAETILQMAMNDKDLLDALPAITNAQTETILKQYIGAEEQKVKDLNSRKGKLPVSDVQTDKDELNDINAEINSITKRIIVAKQLSEPQRIIMATTAITRELGKDPVQKIIDSLDHEIKSSINRYNKNIELRTKQLNAVESQIAKLPQPTANTQESLNIERSALEKNKLKIKEECTKAAKSKEDFINLPQTKMLQLKQQFFTEYQKNKNSGILFASINLMDAINAGNVDAVQKIITDLPSEQFNNIIRSQDSALLHMASAPKTNVLQATRNTIHDLLINNIGSESDVQHYKDQLNKIIQNKYTIAKPH